MDPLVLAKIFSEAGAVAVILFCLIWWINRQEDRRAKNEQTKNVEHKQREERLATRVTELENGRSEKLEALTEKSITVTAENASAFRENARALDRMAETLTGVECIRSDRRKDT